MGDALEVQLHITGKPSPKPAPPQTPRDATRIIIPPPPPLPPSIIRHWKWWLMVTLNISFVMVGQTVATLLGRFYFNQGGKSKWMATLVQSAGATLFLPFLLFTTITTTGPRPPLFKIAVLSTAFALMITVANLMYSYGLLYLPVSTFSVVCSTQLAFTVVFAYFINSHKFTHLIFNSVVLLTFSAALLGVRSSDDSSPGLSKSKYPLGFVLTLVASATFSLILSLTQLTYQKVLKVETFSVVLKLMVGVNLISATASVVGLFASGEWRELGGEMQGFGTGRVSYVATLVGVSVAWQVSSVGTVGLIFVVSSLFSNAIGTVALPVVPVLAVVFFHDKMDGVKVISLLIAMWGFLSYIYQHYLDDLRAKEAMKDDGKAIPLE